MQNGGFIWEAHVSVVVEGISTERTLCAAKGTILKVLKLVVVNQEEFVLFFIKKKKNLYLWTIVWHPLANQNYHLEQWRKWFFLLEYFLQKNPVVLFLCEHMLAWLHSYSALFCFVCLPKMPKIWRFDRKTNIKLNFVVKHGLPGEWLIRGVNELTRDLINWMKNSIDSTINPLIFLIRINFVFLIKIIHWPKVSVSFYLLVYSKNIFFTIGIKNVRHVQVHFHHFTSIFFSFKKSRFMKGILIFLCGVNNFYIKNLLALVFHVLVRGRCSRFS